MTEMSFQTKVERDGSMCFMKIPVDVKAVFGKARPPVLVTVNNHCYPSTVAVYGGESYLPLRKSNRVAAKLDGGEIVEVLLVLDDNRTVEVPLELVRAFADDPGARAAWAALSYSHQREHAEAIESAVRPETRAARVAKCIEMLKRAKSAKPSAKSVTPSAKRAKPIAKPAKPSAKRAKKR